MFNYYELRMQRTAVAIAAVGGVVIGGAKLYLGEHAKAKARKQAEQQKNSRPQLTDSPYTRDELSLAGSELSAGMGADASRALTQENQKSQTNSLDAILKGGGDINNVSKVFDESQSGNQRLALMKENLRLNKIQNFVSASRNADQQRQQQFQFNEWAPWADRSQAIAQEKTQANQDINEGINTIGSSILSGVTNYVKPTPTRTSGGMASNYSSVSSPVENSASENPSPAAGYNTLSGQAPQLNYNLNNSSNTSIWDASTGE